MALNVVLLEPEIPQNTGNIARTCVATHSKLHLIKPFGFEITDRNLKRAGLDYWKYLDVTYYENLEHFRKENPDAFCYYFSTKAQKCHTEVEYPDNTYLFFGKETKGLPEDLLMDNEPYCVRIPMFEEIRSLNLSNSVAIAVYEGLRQQGFRELNRVGKFPTRKE